MGLEVSGAECDAARDLSSHRARNQIGDVGAVGAIALLNGEKIEPKPQAGTLDDVIHKYLQDHVPALKKSTQDAYKWIKQYIEPGWGGYWLSSIKPKTYRAVRP